MNSYLVLLFLTTFLGVGFATLTAVTDNNECDEKSDPQEVKELGLKRCSSPKPIPHQVRDTEYPMDCLEILQNYVSAPSGVYSIYPDGSRPKDAYCDMNTDGGGWTVIQHRGEHYNDESDRTNFYRNYADYEAGFGDANKDYWLGLQDISILTNTAKSRLLVELYPWSEPFISEKYETFRISGGSDQYSLFVEESSGNAGDSLAYSQPDPHGNDVNSNGQKFTTYDQDNDNSNANCAVQNHGAWWYDNCQYSNLNGAYSTSPSQDGYVPQYGAGMSWGTAPGIANQNFYYSFRETWMKIRRQI